MASRRTPLNPAWCLVLASVAAVLAAATWLDFKQFQRERQEVAARLEQPVIAERLGEADPSLLRAPDLDLVRSRLAIALVKSELGNRGAVLPEDQRAAMDLRLQAARELGAQALAARPALADAAAALGASTYMQWVQAEDRRLFTEAASWEGALDLGRRVEPAGQEASKLLATAYLELWPVLSPPKREIARQLLAQVFEDERYLALLAGPWLGIAADREQALEPIPDRAASWAIVSRALAERGDWAGYLEAEERRRRALRTELETALADAARLRRLGATGESRDLYYSVLGGAEPGYDQAELAARVLEEVPAGTATGRIRQDATRWLSWALDRCLNERCPFDEPKLERLAGLSPEGGPAHRALVAMVTGRPEEGERIERRQADLSGEEWLPYLVAKSRWLRGRGELAAARSSLERVGPSGADSSLYWQERLRVDQVRDDESSIQRARQRLAELATRERPASAWRRTDGNDFMLSIFLDRPAVAFHLQVAGPEAGGAFDLRIDGEPVGLYVVTGTAELKVDRALPAGSHTVTLAPRLKARLVPGGVRFDDR